MAGALIQKNHAITALVMGALECIFALIIIICSFVLAGKANMSKSLTPYWAGIPYLIPGILGIVVGFTKNKCSMIAFMILNILCLVLQGVGTILIAIVVAIWAAFAAEVQKHMQNCSDENGECVCRKSDGSTSRMSSSCDAVSSISALLYAIVVILILSAIISLAGSILGCIATCCTNNQPGTIIVQQQAPNQQSMPMNSNPNAPPSYGEKY